MLEWRCNQLLYVFLGNGHLSRLSRQSFQSANIKGDNEVKMGAVLRSPDIYITIEKTSENPS